MATTTRKLVPSSHLRDHLWKWLENLPPSTDLGSGTTIVDGLPAEIRELYGNDPGRLRGALYPMLSPSGQLAQHGLIASKSTGGYCKPGLPEEPEVQLYRLDKPVLAAGKELEGRPTPEPEPEPAANDNGHHAVSPLSAALQENRQHGVSVRRQINSMTNDLMDALGDTGYSYQLMQDQTGGSLTWKNPGSA